MTGASGFIGKSISEQLIGHDVLMTSRSRIAQNKHHYIKKTISGNEDFSECLNSIDIVIHTATRVHKMNDCSENPLADYMETNCFGTLNLARHAANHGVRRFIFLSSIKVNGEQSQPGKPFRYDDPRRAEDSYAKSKAEAEIGLLKIAADTQLEVTIIRSPLVYGPGVKANFAAFLNLASKNLPLPLAAVNNKRSFVALDNLTSLIIRCIDHPKAANQIFLVSDDSDVSTPMLFRIMVKAFGKKPLLLNCNPILLKAIARLFGKGSEIDRLCEDLVLDIEYTKKLLDWTPVISLEEGVLICVSDLVNNN